MVILYRSNKCRIRFLQTKAVFMRHLFYKIQSADYQYVLVISESTQII